MNDDDKIRTLLASAGMLMEDASARVIGERMEAAAAAKLLRDTAHDLQILARVIEVIDRVARS